MAELCKNCGKIIPSSLRDNACPNCGYAVLVSSKVPSQASEKSKKPQKNFDSTINNPAANNPAAFPLYFLGKRVTLKCESLLPLLVSISSITLFILLIYWVSSYYFNNLISEAAFFACLIIGGFLSSFVGGIGGKFFEYRLVFNFEGGSVSYKNNVFENELFSDLGFSLVPVFQAPELISNITQVSVFLKDFDYICLFYFSSGKVYKGLIVRGEEWFFPFFYRLIELSNCIVDFGNPLLQKRFDDYHDSQDASKAAPTPPN